MFRSINNIHFVGIGGIGMSGIAEILLNQGFKVSGSDLNESENTKYLRDIGAKVFIGHNEDNIKDAECIVYSSAVKPDDNPETKAGKQRSIPVIRRAEMLAEVTRLNYCMAVAGTHGKTTTSSLLGLILIAAGIDPTVIVGGRLTDFGGSNARLGKGNWTVVEADEFDRSFLKLLPTIAVINNIEAEHLDIYRDLRDIEDTFVEFANKVPFYGTVILGIDDQGVKEILPSLNKQIITYGLSPQCDYRAVSIKMNEVKTSFELIENGDNLGKIELNIPGEYNIKNALAAISAARQLDIDFNIISDALSNFRGVFRRFDIKGEKNGVLIVDDYAHHPTEVKSALNAARSGWSRRIVAVFQPHTFTRTQHLRDEFGKSFDSADEVIVTKIYPAREKPIDGVTGEIIAAAALSYGHKNVKYIDDFDEIKRYLKNTLVENDMVITLGAGNVVDIADALYTESW